MPQWRGHLGLLSTPAQRCLLRPDHLRQTPIQVADRQPQERVVLQEVRRVPEQVPQPGTDHGETGRVSREAALAASAHAISRQFGTGPLAFPWWRHEHQILPVFVLGGGEGSGRKLALWHTFNAYQAYGDVAWAEGPLRLR